MERTAINPGKKSLAKGNRESLQGEINGAKSVKNMSVDTVK